ncbi:MAG: AAA family ATPase [Bdellovibrionota bacterium]|nr:AAA family ATPase [Bdellovibrionota bacterium]
MSGSFHQAKGRIVLTGGPGGGKTTAAELLKREFREEVVLVPEAATLLFTGGFPRSNDPFILEATQKAIYEVQKSLEDVQNVHFPGRYLLCDRGTLDSAIYWPHGPENFLETMGSSIESELNRYSAVVFFQSAAVGDSAIDDGNPVRNESLSEAKTLDQELFKIWSKHPNFHHIPHEKSFFEKIKKAFHQIEKICKES